MAAAVAASQLAEAIARIPATATRFPVLGQHRGIIKVGGAVSRRRDVSMGYWQTGRISAEVVCLQRVGQFVVGRGRGDGRMVGWRDGWLAVGWAAGTFAV